MIRVRFLPLYHLTVFIAIFGFLPSPAFAWRCLSLKMIASNTFAQNQRGKPYKVLETELESIDSDLRNALLHNFPRTEFITLPANLIHNELASTNINNL